jgi:hypothetical protein
MRFSYDFDELEEVGIKPVAGGCLACPICSHVLVYYAHQEIDLGPARRLLPPENLPIQWFACRETEDLAAVRQ